MTTLTDKEFELLNLWAYCEMNQINGARPETADDVHTYTWADERAAEMGISEKAVGGIMSSLLEKGLIGCTTDEGDDNGVWFTEAGYEAWNAREAA